VIRHLKYPIGKKKWIRMSAVQNSLDKRKTANELVHGGLIGLIEPGLEFCIVLLLA